MKKLRFSAVLLLFLMASLALTAQSSRDFNKFAKFIRQNNLTKIDDLIKRGKDINATNENGMTPLLYCLQQRNVEIAEVFINAGANVNAFDIERRGSLFYAIQYCKNEEIIYSLIKKGADINLQTSELTTPFYLVLLSKSEKLALFMLDKGADINIVNNAGSNSVAYAAAGGKSMVLELLVKKGIDFDLADKKGNTPLLCALGRNQQKTAEQLINLGAKIMVENDTYQTPILYAINNSDTLIFNILLEKGAKLDAGGTATQPINLAASKENKYFIIKLLMNGVKNPMKCDIHDECYLTAFIYSVNAEIANKDEKTGLLQNSINIYNLAIEKYKTELNNIRAAEAAAVGASICMGAMCGVAPVAPVGGNAVRKDYLKDRIDKCEVRIEEIQKSIDSLK